MKIRPARESDHAEISCIHMDAFGTEQGPEIVALVNELLDDQTAKPLLSLVAEIEGRLVGHILFTVAKLHSEGNDVSVRLLAPLAVATNFQGIGVGGALIKEGLKQLAAQGVDLVFVLGHPGYYPRSGFQPAGVLGFDAPYPIPLEHADAWMVQELRAGVIDSVKGTVQCAEVLNQPQHWQE